MRALQRKVAFDPADKKNADAVLQEQKSKRTAEKIMLKGVGGMEEKAVIEWLERIKKLDELIRAKRAEIIGQATKMTASLDGMPHGGGVSDKVGDGAVELAENEELHTLKQKRQYIIDTIKLLPAKQFGVINREFVEGMTQEEIAEDMNYCTVQVWRIKKSALRLLGEILEKKGDRF